MISEEEIKEVRIHASNIENKDDYTILVLNIIDSILAYGDITRRQESTLVSYLLTRIKGKPIPDKNHTKKFRILVDEDNIG